MAQLIQGRKGGGGKGHTPVESPDNLLSTSTAKILLAVSNGEIASGLDDTKIFLDGTPIGNADGSRNFEGVTWEFRPGSQQQEYIKGMPSVDNEINIGMELKSDQPWIRSISNTQLSAVRVRFSVPQLLQQRDNGDTTGYRIEYAIDLSTDGAGFKEVINAAFDGKTTSTYERSHRINLPSATTGWQIRVRRLTSNKNSGRYADKVNIQAIAEVIDVKLRYPNTALLFVTFNAEQFNNRIPKISVLSKGLLIKVPSNYNPDTRSYSGIWDGTFKLAHSSNPAWVFYDILLSKLYGLGDRLEASQVDKWELYRIAQYCDQLVPDGRGGDGKEPRFMCDVYIQAQNEAYSVLRDLAAIFRGMTYWSDNKIVAIADIPRDVSRVFTKASVVDGKFNGGGGSLRNRYTHALVSYGDPSNHYNDAIEVASDNKLVRRYGVNQTEITAIGCTRQSEANRRGRWALLTNANDRTVSFATGLEGKIPLPGDIIGVADELFSGRVIGGRVSECNSRNITLDRKPDAKEGDRLLINLPGGKSEARTVQAVNDTVVTVTTAYSEMPQKNAVWSIDADDLAIQLYRVTSIDDNNDNTFTISGVYHNPEKYDHIDTGARIDERPISVIPPGVQPPPKNVRISSYTKIVQGLAVTTLRSDWDSADSAIAYESEWRKDNGNWVSAPRTSALGFEVDNIYAGRYQVRVRAINASDISSIWANAQETTLKGKEGNPPVPLNFRTTPIVFGITIDWNFGDDTSDTLKTEIQYSKTNDGEGLMLLTDIPYPQRTHTMQGLAAGVAFYFRARLVDKTGNQSPWTEFVRGESSSDASWIIDAAGDQFLTTEAGKALQSQIDDNAEAVLENAAARGADTKRWMKENGDRKAEIIEVREVQVSDQQSFARYQQQVSSQFENTNSSVLNIKESVSKLNESTAKDINQVKAEVNNNTNGITLAKGLIQENKTAIANTDKALSEYQTQTSAQFKDQKALIETKATTVFDKKGDGSATWSVKAGVNYDGQYYGAGMVIGAQVKDGKISTSIGFNAETFGVFNPSNGKLESVFFIKNGQIFMRSAFIDKTVIQELLVGVDIKSLNYVPNKSGLHIDMKNGTFEVNGISGGYRMKITNMGIYIFNSSGIPIIELGKFL
ncbi:Fibronectin type III domain protein [Photorhabdus australis subsp. thailandensis]|uniref:Fibronectin type III domain protein n=1 Tax=Photorhabdus australis subsp. thailandensis TaxID=2805096 RepID=A0A1C0U6N4_9GAMM|nr:host specificity protein J [Photorhabdus australis]OCQ53536.1 Fibronectin type III domain protein [Photorhabdus australis subsp. thailandensis]